MATTARDLGHQGAKGSAGTPSAAAELAAAAQRAQTFAGGSGAAVLSVENGELVCQAISGSSPPVGTRFPLAASFPGLCIKERKPLKCDEADTDARVEKGVYVALKIKSIVVVPIMQQQNAAGVLAVFSSSASAFHNTHIAILRTMADSTLGALQAVREEAANTAPAVNGGTLQAPARQAAPVIPEFVVRPGAGVQPRDVVAPSPVVPKPVMAKATPRSTPITPPAPTVPVRRPPAVMQPVREPVSSPQALNKKEEIVSLAADVGPRPTTPRATPPPTISPRVKAAMDRPAPSRPRRYEGRQQKRGFLPFAVAAMLFAAIAAGAWGLYTRRSRPALAQREPAQLSAQEVLSAAAPQSAPTAEPVEPADTQLSDNSVAVRDVATAELRPTIASANLAAAKREPEPKSATKAAKRAGLADISERRSVPAATPVTPTTPQAGLTPIKPPAATPSQVPAEAPIKVALLPNTVPVTAPASLPTLAPAKPTETRPAEIIKRVPPSYPPLALSSHASGTVRVTATVSKEGRVTTVQVVSGPPLFREAAISAVKQWSFKPATVNGVATESTANIVLKFTNAAR